MSCRPFLLALAVCALPVAPAVLSAQGFEGTVTYAMNPSSGKPGQLVYQVKGTRIRADITGATGGPPGGMYMLMDATSGKMMSVMPAQKVYMTMDLQAMGEQMKQQHGGHKKHAAKAGKITKTGKTETIAGHKCEHYLMGEQQDSDVCAAKGLGMFMGGNAAGGMGRAFTLPAGYEEYAEFAKDGFLPLKVSAIRNGKEEVVMEATRVEKKSLDASLFAVPTGYQEMDMGKMMQQMQKQQKQPGGR
ncbi:MAG: DUF4412 domain-containing protein [Gemmatimonadales bacterium]